MDMEDRFMDLARMDGVPTVVICDRGLLDSTAYITQELWHTILDETGYSINQLREKRYDCVIHLSTAADGADKFYQIENNNARIEGIKTAIEVDRKLRQAYHGHPKFYLVDNSFPTFHSKLQACVEKVTGLLGIPVPKDIFKKFLVKGNVKSIKIPDDVLHETIHMSETQLRDVNEGKQDHKTKKRTILRKRGKEGHFYYNTESRYIWEGQRIQKKRQITAREYMEMMQMKDPQFVTIEKERTSFIWNNTHYLLETYLNIHGQPTILRIETSKEEIKFPPFIEIIRDVSECDSFFSRNMARPDYKMLDGDKAKCDFYGSDSLDNKEPYAAERLKPRMPAGL